MDILQNSNVNKTNLTKIISFLYNFELKPYYKENFIHQFKKFNYWNFYGFLI